MSREQNFAESAYGQPQKKGCMRFWWLGLLLGLVFIVIPMASCIGLGVWGMSAVKEPVNAAVAAVNADAEITAKLGQVTCDNEFGIKDFTASNGNGSATVDTNVTGPNGSARVEGRMKVTAGNWSADGLTVTCDDGTEFRIPRE